MLNQTFSRSNFEEIYDEDNRRGKNQDDILFPSLKNLTGRISIKAKALRAFRAKYNSFSKYPKDVQKRYDRLNKNLKRELKKRENLIMNELDDVANNINQPSFRIPMNKNTDFVKAVYQTDDSSSAYYALKQISRNIRSLYKTKPADRNLIISQVSNLLQDDYPYLIIRTDISSFFESINHKKLEDKIVDDQLLSTTSIKLIKQILWDYSRLSGTVGQGLPRGFGVSSDLAELFMRQVDRQIMALEEVTYYARYVDDIIIFISPTILSMDQNHLDKIRPIIENHELSMNESKTSNLKRFEGAQVFEYLGYKFTLTRPIARIEISDNRYQKYLIRIKSSFSAYEKQRHKNSKKAYRLLLKRVKFLTGNTRLVNSKSNAFIGTFFSNPYINDLRKLNSLDQILSNFIEQIDSISLRAKLSQYSFSKGHVQQTFHKFNRRRRTNLHDEFLEIVEVWKYAQ